MWYFQYWLGNYYLTATWHILLWVLWSSQGITKLYIPSTLNIDLGSFRIFRLLLAMLYCLCNSPKIKIEDRSYSQAYYLHWDFRNFWHPLVWNIQFDELEIFPSLKTNWIFLPVQTGFFFPSFWARVKYFDGPCLTIYSLFTI